MKIQPTSTRTRADRLGDAVSLAVLLLLGAFAVAVSFSHTMDFVRLHGQPHRWIVTGTACTVVGLTVQSGMEVWRDRRDGRTAKGSALLLAVGVAVELVANAAPAHGAVNRFVAAWPVLVAAAALHLWTRRLTFAAAAEGAGRRTVPEAVAWDVPPFRPGPAPGAPAVEVPLVPAAAGVDEDLVEADELLADAPVPQWGDKVAAVLAEPGTVKEKGAAVLALFPDLTAEEIASILGCTVRYGRMIRQEADETARTEQIPGQLDMLAASVA